MSTLDDDHDKASEKRESVKAFEDKQKSMNTEPLDTSHYSTTNSKIPLSKSKRRRKRKRVVPVTKLGRHDTATKSSNTFKHTVFDADNTNEMEADESDQLANTYTSTSNQPKNEPGITANIYSSVVVNSNSTRHTDTDTQQADESTFVTATPPPPSSPVQSKTETIATNISSPSSIKKEADAIWIPSTIEPISSNNVPTTSDMMTKKAESDPPLSHQETIDSDSKRYTKISHCMDLACGMNKLENVAEKTESFISPAITPPPPPTTTTTAPPQEPDTPLSTPSSVILSSPDLSVTYPEKSTTPYQPDATSEIYPLHPESEITTSAAYSPESTSTAYFTTGSPAATHSPDPVPAGPNLLVVEEGPPKVLDKRPWNEENESNNQSHDHDSVSTYSPDNIFSFEHEGETCYCIGFEKNQKLVFIGYALIGVLYGSIEMNGATISAKTNLPSRLKLSFGNLSQYVSFYPVFSPRTFGLTVIQSTCYEEVVTSSPSTTLYSAFDDVAQLLEPLEERWENFESIIMVKGLNWCGVEQLEQVIPSLQNAFRLGTKDGYVTNDGPFYDDMVGFQPITNVTPEVKALQNQPSWKISIDRLLQYEQVHAVPSISVICGNKNVNKSAFARYMINQLLKSHYRVAYLETDVGQTEFTPTGLVSLHVIDTPLLGPSFTHPHLKCKQSFFIGTTTTTQMDATYYQDCVKQLLSRYRQECEEWTKIAQQDEDGSYLLPLVVNTHGWISGVGYDLLFSLMEYAKPSHIFGLTSPTCYGYMPDGDFPGDFAHRAILVLPQHLSIKHQLMFLTAPTPTAELIEQHHHRQFMLLSYLYHNPQTFGQASTKDIKGKNNSWWQVAPPLIDRTPWLADWREQIDGVWVFYDEVPLSQLLYVLNGALVGLVGHIRSLDDEGDDHDFMVIEGKDTTDQPPQGTITKSKLNKNKWILPNYHPAKTSAKPTPTTTTCFGIGVIRAVDPERQQFHILTPLPANRLEQVTCLIKGDLEIPIFSMVDQGSIRMHQQRGVF